MRCAINFMGALGVNWTETFKPERRAGWDDIAEEIHSSVTMRDVIGRYCPEYMPRRNRMRCPIHAGHDLNFSFTDVGYKCFVCGESGDVIKFVQTVCNLRDRKDAMALISRDFGLSLSVDKEISYSESKALEERRRALREKQRAHDEWEQGLSALWDEWCRLDRQRMFCKPDTGAYAEAVKNIDRVAYAIDCYPAEPG